MDNEEEFHPTPRWGYHQELLKRTSEQKNFVGKTVVVQELREIQEKVTNLLKYLDYCEWFESPLTKKD